MLKKKFGPDDIFFNTVRAYPEFNLSYYFNNSYINNRQTQGNRVQSGSVSLFELNVERPTGQPLVQPFIVKNENLLDFVFTNVDSVSTSEYSAFESSQQLTGAYPLTASVSRERLIGNNATHPFGGFTELSGVAGTNSIRKIIALENVLNSNKVLSPKFDFNEFYIDDGINPSYTNFLKIASPKQKHTTLWSFPEIFKGQRIKPGSVELNFYITGTLMGTAKDINRNGELIETLGPSSSAVVGTVSYSEGVMIITGNYNLNDHVDDGYLCPITGTDATTAGPTAVTLQTAWQDKPKWVHFGAYQSFIRKGDTLVSQSYAPVSSSYELKFKGTNTVPTLTMFCHADKNEFNWTNNLTYIDRTAATGSSYQQMVVATTGSKVYREKDEMPVKNTISSSFANYSSSYSDQTFISKVNIFDNDGNIIAVAKMAKPVTKTNNTDYTFKLKIDI